MLADRIHVSARIEQSGKFIEIAAHGSCIDRIAPEVADLMDILEWASNELREVLFFVAPQDVGGCKPAIWWRHFSVTR